MQRVLRWDVPVDDQWHQIGAGYVLETAARSYRDQPGDTVEVWTLEDTGDSTDSTQIPMRDVTIVGTGHHVPPNSEHVGTAIVPAFDLVTPDRRGGVAQIHVRPGLVWHVFAKYDPQTERAQLAAEADRIAHRRAALPANTPEFAADFLVRRPETPTPTTTEPNIGGFTRGLLVRIDSINLDDYQGRGAVVCSLDHDHGWRLWVRIGDDPHDMEQTALYVSPDDLRIP